MPFRRWCFGAFLVLAGWVFADAPSECQAPAPLSAISIEVTDPSGARIPRAAIHIHGTGLEQDAAADRTGEVDLRLPGGTYVISVEAPGFRESHRETMLSPGEHRQLKFKLAIDAPEEKISVDPFAAASDSTGSLTLGAQQMEILSDDPSTLRQQLAFMAGATGMGGAQFVIDGFSNGQVPPKSAIRAIHINNNPYSTLYDRPGFGRVEIDTQAGGNQRHGMLDFGGTASALNSNNPYTSTQPPYHQLLFRGNIGGPIGKVTSYFVAGNTSDLQNNAVINAVDPLAPDTVISEATPNPVREDDYSFRLDHRFSQTNQLNGRYEFHRLHQNNAGVGLLVLPSEGYTSNSLIQTLQLADNEVFNPRFVNDLRFQYIRTRIAQDPNSTAPTLVVQGSFNAGGSPLQFARDNQDQYELQENVSIDRGRHFIRTGLRYRLFRDSNNSTAGYNGQFVFPDVATYQAGTPTQFSLNAGRSNAAINTGELGLYGEDEWKLRRNFTLDFGLRYESQTAIPDHNDPAPRVGFSWAIGRKTSPMPFVTIRGGAGLFYVRLTAADLLPTVRQNGTNQLAYLVQNPSFYPTVPPASSLTAAQPTIYRLQPQFSTGRNFLASLTAEHIIGHIGTIAVNVLEADGRHQYLLVNANAPLPGTVTPSNPSGVRPMGGSQNIYQLTTEGTGHQQEFFTNLNLNPTRRLSVFAFYVAQKNHSDANGPTWFASNSYNIRQDYGRDDSDVAQQFFAGASINLPFDVAIMPFVSARSGKPFNITTGTDLNGDTIYNDRPAFATDLARPSVVQTRYGNFDTAPLPTQTTIPYNYGRGPALSWVDLQVAKEFHLGPRSAQMAAGQPGGKMGPQGPRGPDRPWTLSFSVEAQNLFNHVNPGQPVGVLSSPLLGRSLTLANDFSPLTAANRTILLHSTFRF